MKKRNEQEKRRKAALDARKWCETLDFQTQWCVRKRGLELTSAMVKRVEEEQAFFCAAGLAEDLLALKGALEGLHTELETDVLEAGRSIAQSVVAYCLGVVPECPVMEEGSGCGLQLKLPFYVELFLNPEKRNAASEWLSVHGFDMTTYMGQPMIRMNRLRVVLRRAGYGL